MIPRQRIPSPEPMEEKRPLRRQPEDHHFSSLIMLAVTAAAFLLVTWVATKALFVLPSRVSNALKADWQRHVLASSGYLELGMFDDAALVLEEIAPEDKTRNEVLGARVNLYITAKKWDMAAAVASHLVKVEPESARWWISFAYAIIWEREHREGWKPFCAGASHSSQGCHDLVQPCVLREREGRTDEAKERLARAIKLDKNIR